MAVAPLEDLDTASAVLDFARQQRRAADEAESRLLQAAVQWCVVHPGTGLDDASRWDADFGDRAVALAGAGAPVVSEFSIFEFAAAVGMSTDAGRAYLSEALELRYRLPKTWGRLTAGDLPAWRARRIAERTLRLPVEGAGFVDTHVAPVAHSVSVRAVDRLVEEAETRFDPAAAEERRHRLAEQRHFDVDLTQFSSDGHVQVGGLLDLKDALDLEDAVARGAHQLRALGSEETRDARRATALGNLARRDLVLEFDVEPTPLVVHVHQSQHESEETGQPAEDPGLDPVIRVDNLRRPLPLGQLHAWLARGGCTVTIKPVIDLRGQIHVESYEVPDRIRDHVTQRDRRCVFPHCARPAAGCQVDHVVPHGTTDGATATTNLAPLCPRHHRGKTHGGWAYAMPTPGTCVWTSPHGLRYLVDPRGTHPVNPRGDWGKPPPDQ